MKRQTFLLTLALGASSLWAQQATVSGPDNQLKVEVSVDNGNPFYSVTYKGGYLQRKNDFREVPSGVCRRHRRLQQRNDIRGTEVPQH